MARRTTRPAAPPIRQYSIAQARSSLPSLVHTAEQGEPVELTRRGRAVAVILSVMEYQKLMGRKPDFYEALLGWRKEHQQDLDDELFVAERDRTTGREAKPWG